MNSVEVQVVTYKRRRTIAREQVSDMPRTFAKRTFTMPLLLRSFGAFVLSAPVRWIGLVKPAIPRALREEVFLGVTSVNDCRWCSWLHSGIALSHGVNLGNLQSLLGSGTVGTVDDGEATAIHFAQHFADTLRHPTPAARLALAKQFTPRQCREIMAWIHFIYFTNLAGNSADAWLARFRGWELVEGHPFAEALAGLVAAPVLLMGWLCSRRWRPAALSEL
jgi:AhpD family alkylhydroperoxidase